jgi:hypothetical protein
MMYVCEVCHRKLCSMNHVVLTYAACELCQRNAECVDCVSSSPMTAAEIEAQNKNKEIIIGIYKHTKEVYYPRRK